MSVGSNSTVQGLDFNIGDASGSVVSLAGDNSQIIDSFFSGSTQNICVDMPANATQTSHCYFNNVNSNFCIRLNGGFFTNVTDNIFRSVNASNGPLIQVVAATTNFNIIGNFNGGGGSPAHSVVVAVGASDNYNVALNNFGGVSISDGGTGTNKNITLNV